MKKINNDRSIAKKLILAILNGGFLEKYHDDKNINKFLKDIENESKMLHDYFYKIDKRIDDEKIFIIIKVNHFHECYKIMKINY